MSRRMAVGGMTFAIMAGFMLQSAAEEAPAGLKSPEAFASIKDETARSQALFTEAGRVIQSPRCVNCHPAGDRPLQGADGHPHLPYVRRGEAGMGVPGLYCTTCHGPANKDVVTASVPGNPKWQLAPIEMAWEGRTLGQICAQIKDPARNGGKTMDKLIDHMAHDELVGWGWAPGRGRTPAPGSQEAFGLLIQAWADTGAHCPD